MVGVTSKQTGIVQDFAHIKELAIWKKSAKAEKYSPWTVRSAGTVSRSANDVARARQAIPYAKLLKLTSRNRSRQTKRNRPGVQLTLEPGFQMWCTAILWPRKKAAAKTSFCGLLRSLLSRWRSSGTSGSFFAGGVAAERGAVLRPDTAGTASEQRCMELFCGKRCLRNQDLSPRQKINSRSWL